MLKSSSIKTSSLYSLISEATDNLLQSEDEDLNMKICLEILRTSDGPKVAAKIINKIINKALSTRCSQSIWYCLLLLDLAVKNTDSRFCAAILTKDFLTDLIKIMDQKYHVPDFVQEKLQYILKEWQASLTNVNGHQNLSRYNRPAIAPIVTNYPTGDVQTLRQHGLPYLHPPLQMNPGCLEKEKVTRDIDIIETNLSIFSDTLRATTPDRMTNEECLFLKDLNDIIKKMQVRINDLLPQLAWEDVTNQLLQVNDKINSTSERFVRLMSSKAQNVLNSASTKNVQRTDEIIDMTHSLNIANNTGPSMPEIYDIPSLPSYTEASSKLSKINGIQPSNDLINFDDSTPAFYKSQPLPPIPMNSNEDLLTGPLPDASGNQNHMSSDDFDSFIESIARRHDQNSVPEEEYAPPIYDEASLNRDRRS